MASCQRNKDNNEITKRTKVVTDESNATSKDEKTVQCPNLRVFVCFFRCEGTAIPQEVNEAYSDTTVNIQDKLMDDVSAKITPHRLHILTVSFLAVVTFSTARA